MSNRDLYDKVVGDLDGLPDVRHTRPTTISTVLPMVGSSLTFVVQTYRQKDRGDTILLQVVDAEGGWRTVLPPKVADAIARQRDALTTATRRANARAAAQDRMARGELPAFVRRRAEERTA